MDKEFLNQLVSQDDDEMGDANGTYNDEDDDDNNDEDENPDEKNTDDEDTDEDGEMAIEEE